MQGKRKVLKTPAIIDSDGVTVTSAIYKTVVFADTKAEVWVDPARKVKAEADGSYELEVANHSGTFTINANYTNPDGNYKQSNPQTVKTTSPTHSLNIPLNYGYTVTLSGEVGSIKAGDIGLKDGATIIIEVEGVEIGRTTSGSSGMSKGNYSITFAHPGAYKARVNLAGYEATDFHEPIYETKRTMTKHFFIR